MAYQQHHDKSRATWLVLLNTGLILLVGTPAVLLFVLVSELRSMECETADSDDGLCSAASRHALATGAFAGLVLGLLCSAILGGILISKRKSILLAVLLSWGLVVCGVVVQQLVIGIQASQLADDRQNKLDSEIAQQDRDSKQEADRSPRFPVIDSMVTRLHDDVLAELAKTGGRWDWGLFKDSWTRKCGIRDQHLMKDTVQLDQSVGGLIPHGQNGNAVRLTPDGMQQVRDAFRVAAANNGFTYKDTNDYGRGGFEVTKQDVRLGAYSYDDDVRITLVSRCHYR